MARYFGGCRWRLGCQFSCHIKKTSKSIGLSQVQDIKVTVLSQLQDIKVTMLKELPDIKVNWVAKDTRHHSQLGCKSFQISKSIGLP